MKTGTAKTAKKTRATAISLGQSNLTEWTTAEEAERLNALSNGVTRLLNEFEATPLEALNVLIWALAGVLYDHPIKEEPGEAIKVRLQLILRKIEEQEQEGKVPLA
jgi:hypothetical protein